MALDPNIALGVRPLELANPLAQYGQVAQIQSAQNQNQVSQMQLDQMKRDEATMQQIQAKSTEHGGPSDLNEIANAYLKSGNPKFVEFGVGLRQKLDDHAQFAKIMGMGNTPAAPMAAPAATPMAAPAPTNALGSGTFGMEQPTNALTAAAPAAPASVNALAAPAPGPDVAMLRRKRDAFLAMGTPQATAAARAMDAEIALASKEPVYHVVPGVGLVDPRTSRVITPSVEVPPSEVKEYEYAKKQGFKGSLFDFKRELANAGRAPVQPVAPTITQIVDPTNPNNTITIDARSYKGGGLGSPGVIGTAKPSAFAEKTAGQQKQMGKDLNLAITEIENAIKPGGLLEQSTASGAGKLRDTGAAFFGKATSGAIAAASLKPIADLGLKMIPRFEGPQSDKDTASYKEAAGQLANESLPTETRRSAAQNMVRLMKARKGQFVNDAMAAEGITPAAEPNIDALLNKYK